jgi:DNA-binding IclR family transcriptional regulator
MTSEKAATPSERIRPRVSASARTAHDGQTDGRDLQVLARATSVLNMFSTDRPRIDLAGATSELGLNRSTVYRYLSAMVKHGLLVHTQGQGYSLGPLASRVGLLALDRAPLISRADPVMQILSEQIHETSTLSVWGGSGPLVARVHDEQSRFIRISIAVGSTLPINTAQGQIFLAHLTNERSVARATLGLSELERARLLDRREDVRRTRIAFSDASADGLRCVAAPIYGPDGSLAATLALIGTLSRIPDHSGDVRVEALVKAARSLSTG